MAPLNSFQKLFLLFLVYVGGGKYDCRLEALDPSGSRVNRE